MVTPKKIKTSLFCTKCGANIDRDLNGKIITKHNCLKVFLDRWIEKGND